VPSTGAEELAEGAELLAGVTVDAVVDFVRKPRRLRGWWLSFSAMAWQVDWVRAPSSIRWAATGGGVR
jgi:hypothetical protein